MEPHFPKRAEAPILLASVALRWAEGSSGQQHCEKETRMGEEVASESVLSFLGGGPQRPRPPFGDEHSRQEVKKQAPLGTCTAESWGHNQPAQACLSS